MSLFSNASNQLPAQLILEDFLTKNKEQLHTHRKELESKLAQLNKEIKVLEEKKYGKITQLFKIFACTIPVIGQISYALYTLINRIRFKKLETSLEQRLQQAYAISQTLNSFENQFFSPLQDAQQKEAEITVQRLYEKPALEKSDISLLQQHLPLCRRLDLSKCAPSAALLDTLQQTYCYMTSLESLSLPFHELSVQEAYPGFIPSANLRDLKIKNADPATLIELKHSFPSLEKVHLAETNKTVSYSASNNEYALQYTQENGSLSSVYPFSQLAEERMVDLSKAVETTPLEEQECQLLAPYCKNLTLKEASPSFTTNILPALFPYMHSMEKLFLPSYQLCMQDLASFIPSKKLAALEVADASSGAQLRLKLDFPALDTILLTNKQQTIRYIKLDDQSAICYESELAPSHTCLFSEIAENELARLCQADELNESQILECQKLVPLCKNLILDKASDYFLEHVFMLHILPVLFSGTHSLQELSIPFLNLGSDTLPRSFTPLPALKKLHIADANYFVLLQLKKQFPSLKEVVFSNSNISSIKYENKEVENEGGRRQENALNVFLQDADQSTLMTFSEIAELKISLTAQEKNPKEHQVKECQQLAPYCQTLELGNASPAFLEKVLPYSYNLHHLTCPNISSLKLKAACPRLTFLTLVIDDTLHDVEEIKNSMLADLDGLKECSFIRASSAHSAINLEEKDLIDEEKIEKKIQVLQAKIEENSRLYSESLTVQKALSAKQIFGIIAGFAISTIAITFTVSLILNPLTLPWFLPPLAIALLLGTSCPAGLSMAALIGYLHFHKVKSVTIKQEELLRQKADLDRKWEEESSNYTKLINKGTERFLQNINIGALFLPANKNHQELQRLKKLGQHATKLDFRFLNQETILKTNSSLRNLLLQANNQPQQAKSDNWSRFCRFFADACVTQANLQNCLLEPLPEMDEEIEALRQNMPLILQNFCKIEELIAPEIELDAHLIMLLSPMLQKLEVQNITNPDSLILLARRCSHLEKLVITSSSAENYDQDQIAQLNDYIKQMRQYAPALCVSIELNHVLYQWEEGAAEPLITDNNV